MLPYQGIFPPYLVTMLDAQSQWAASLSSGGAQHFTMENGATYLLQPIGGSGTVGFGADTTTADTDGAAGKGEFIDSYEVRRVVASDPTKLILSYTPTSGSTELRIRKLDVMVYTTPQG